MKRFLHHVLFWLLFFLMFAYESFLWDRGTFATQDTRHVFFASVLASVVFMVPQILFPYYMVYFGIENIFKKKRTLLINIAEIIIVFFICIIIDRLISNYIALPYIYKAPRLISPLFEPRRLLSASMYIGYAFGLMYAVKSVKDQFIAKEKEKNLIKEKLETELKFLKNQTNPHFLLNTLNNIYALARKRSERTAEVVMRLSELLRFMLYESDRSLIKLSTEIKILEDYLELESMRYNQRLEVTLEKDVDSTDYEITPFLLIPFLENAFKHGVSETRFASFINISISAKNNLLNFEIENSKDPHSNEKESSNIGLMNVKRRLELTYSDYNLDVKNNSNSFKIHITVNLNSYVEI